MSLPINGLVETSFIKLIVFYGAHCRSKFSMDPQMEVGLFKPSIFLIPKVSSRGNSLHCDHFPRSGVFYTWKAFYIICVHLCKLINRAYIRIPNHLLFVAANRSSNIFISVFTWIGVRHTMAHYKIDHLWLMRHLIKIFFIFYLFSVLLKFNPMVGPTWIRMKFDS